MPREEENSRVRRTGCEKEAQKGSRKLLCRGPPNITCISKSYRVWKHNHYEYSGIRNLL